MMNPPQRGSRRRRSRYAIAILIALPFVLVAFLAGYLLHIFLFPAAGELSLLEEARGLIVEYYLGDLPQDLILERGMIRGMLETLSDPYTVFVEPEKHQMETEELTGEYAGIGAYLSLTDQGTVILHPFPNAPAAVAGVLDGDQLTAIDGAPLPNPLTVESIAARLRGKEGTRVVLTIARANSAEANTFQVTVERRRFAIPSVIAMRMPENPDIGVVAITLFGANTHNELVQALTGFGETGIRSLVLDLRDNGGGLLSASVDIADFFLSSGVIVIEEDAQGKRTTHEARPGDAGESLPLVVLINHNTASASEVVAAALRANGRAVLIGEQTFGKGSVQAVFELQDGSSLHVTAAQWLTPNGTAISGEGLTPDIPVKDERTETEGDAILKAAADWLLRDEGSWP